MRTLIFTSLLAGCTTYPTLEEACNDRLPGGDLMSFPIDKDVALYMNCHRRQNRSGQARVSSILQPAVEPHAVYLETNKPLEEQNFQQAGKEPFTGNTFYDRAAAQGWVAGNGSQLLSLFTFEFNDFANVYTGRELFDLWFAYPVFRQAWLQDPMLGFGVVSGDYTIEFPEDSGLDDIPLHFTYWNIHYQVPLTAYAQTPIKFPPNGATDVPAKYTHLVNDDILTIGGEYGYPITFSVGAGESGLTIDSAAVIGPSGPISITTLIEGAGLQNLTNTVILVPDDPLTVGATYTASAKITTDQGTRNSKTTFTVGSRTLPDFGIQTSARGTGQLPQLGYSLEGLEGLDKLISGHGTLKAR